MASDGSELAVGEGLGAVIEIDPEAKRKLRLTQLAQALVAGVIQLWQNPNHSTTPNMDEHRAARKRHRQGTKQARLGR